MNIRNRLFRSKSQVGQAWSLLVVTAIVLLGVVMFLAPGRVLRGEATDTWELLAGVIGIGFWALAIGVYTGAP